MWRYLRLYAYFLRFSASKAMEFRVDYYFRVVMDIVYYAVNIAFYRIIFAHTSLLADWNLNQMMVFVGSYLVLDALHMTLFANNMWWFPVYINRGDLDYYLTRPVSTLFFLSTREVAFNSLLNLFFALGILIWALVSYEGFLSPLRLLVFSVLLLNGVFLYYMVHVAMLMPVVWTQSGRGFDRVFFLMSRTLERPDRIYTGWVRKLLVTALPFGLMASFPARIIFDGFDLGLVLHVLAATAILLTALLVTWRIALRSYSSASS